MNNIKRVLKITAFILLVLISSTVHAQKVLTIDDAISIALKNNYDILVARNDATVAKVNNTPGNAGMLPTVGVIGSGNYGISNTTQNVSSGIENTYPVYKSSSISLGAQLNWTLFDGGKMFVAKSKLNEIQALGEIQFKDKVLKTLYNVVAAYYDVVRQKQQLSSINEVMNYNRDRVTVSQAGFNAGSLIKIDLLQAKIDLNVTTESHISQQFRLNESFKTLNLLLGKNGEEAFDINDSIPVNYTPDKEDLLKKLNSSNSSILNFQKQLDIAQLTLKENRALYLPNLSFKGGYYWSRTSNTAGTVLYNNSIGPQVGGLLTIPIYSAGETKRKVTTAKIEAETAELDLQNIKLQVNTALLNTLTDFENQEQLLKIETENNQLAKENMQISFERLKHGQTTSTELHLAEDNYVQSSTRLINFRYNLKIAETSLKQLVSGL